MCGRFVEVRDCLLFIYFSVDLNFRDLFLYLDFNSGVGHKQDKLNKGWKQTIGHVLHVLHVDQCPALKVYTRNKSYISNVRVRSTNIDSTPLHIPFSESIVEMALAKQGKTSVT